MTESVDVLTLADRERWIEAHDEGGLPGQSWAYASALAASGIQPRLAVVRSAGARMLMPFVERSWMGATDVATIMGLSGASVVPASLAPLSAWRNYATRQGLVAGYIHLSTALDFERSLEPGEPLSSNTVFLLQLQRNQPIELISDNLRSKVQEADALGVRLVDARALLAEALQALYPVAMRRVGARSHYMVAAETLDRWAVDSSSLVLGGAIGDRIEAVSLFGIAGRVAEYQINASSDAGRALTTWLLTQAMVRLRDMGVEVLNLGGGVRAGDGLYAFKKRFGGIPAPVYSIGQIYDRARYAELCRTAGASAEEKWFPAYRARIDLAGV